MFEHEVCCRHTGNGSPHRNLKETEQKDLVEKHHSTIMLTVVAVLKLLEKGLETSAVPTCTVRSKLRVWLKRELQWTLQIINEGRPPLQTLMFIVSNFMNSAVWEKKKFFAGLEMFLRLGDLGFSLSSDSVTPHISHPPRVMSAGQLSLRRWRWLLQRTVLHCTPTLAHSAHSLYFWPAAVRIAHMVLM